MSFKQITSSKNAYIKEITLLKDKSKIRRKSGLFLIEGAREISLAIKGNYALETILFYEDLFPEEALNKLLITTINKPEIISISKEVYQKLAYRDTTEGILAIAKSKDLSFESLKFENKNPLLLIAEAPEKPGNIGAILRTADAANVDAVIIANPKTDLYNPNIIRSSVGCVFTNQIATGSTEEIIHFLKENNINIYSAILQEAVNYHEQDYTQASAIVVGTEADGLSETWRKASKQNIKIPMQGEIDSMNVSVAAGILIFEAKRQRNFK
ncbi:RNA methyltransferase [Oceanihabitans sediminis]|uniref:RNA methyltransferase n=1 Tax=Oceanihabitans sediminis TaxID=1812012 RepID=A0A368P2Z4_9FLAO|nr:RNA methyltransferase [Oceanihabitans sediminis]MDX1277972.1 RNA methyltransferase [Oceanihabitans sediminis]MDX1774119.1 RNA methyltransferase [Oceanihabitans sediminis]RBP30840.1 TrmH family RNA methyltransferase [Oceanihabitans sediminis]RCU56806.1 RNA methyltransferase [Oceanihabitans sediminis]